MEDIPAKYAVGEKCRVMIDDLAFGGEGVARPDGFVIFVPFVIPGEVVDIEITEAKKSFARARLLDVVESSKNRVKPQCDVFAVCGGCQYQHIDYQTQVGVKHKQVSDLFQRLGGIDPKLVRPLVPCPQPFHYRNRIMVRTQWNREKKDMNVGFLRHDSRLVVDVEECKIAEHELNEELVNIRKNPPRRNGIKVVVRKFPEDWELPPDSFFQNNFSLLPKLVETVRLGLRSNGSRHLIDAYCGVGFFGIELAGEVESFVGVEIDRMGIKAANANLNSRGIKNGEFLEGKAEEMLPDLLARMPAESTSLILDPPRKGCPPDSLGVIRSVRPSQVLYISCHPATLARDLKILTDSGVYRIEGITPLDMFPQTQHVECVADLRLTD